MNGAGAAVLLWESSGTGAGVAQVLHRCCTGACLVLLLLCRTVGLIASGNPGMV